jgi:hypothetical protein
VPLAASHIEMTNQDTMLSFQIAALRYQNADQVSLEREQKILKLLEKKVALKKAFRDLMTQILAILHGGLQYQSAARWAIYLWARDKIMVCAIAIQAIQLLNAPSTLKNIDYSLLDRRWPGIAKDYLKTVDSGSSNVSETWIVPLEELKPNRAVSFRAKERELGPDGKGALPTGVPLARYLTFREKDPNLWICRYFLCEDCLISLQTGTGKPQSLEAQQWGA